MAEPGLREQKLSRRPLGALTNWGRFGPEDELGTVNFLTPAAVLRGVSAVRTGDRYALNLPLDLPAGIPGRVGLSKHGQGVGAELDGIVSNDDYVVMSLQGSSQWDALAHFGRAEADGALYYNGRGPDAVGASGYAHRNGIDKVAQRGIAGRGVLLDVARMVAGGVADPLPDDYVIDEVVVSRCAQHEGIELATGDILCFRTGWLERYRDSDPAERRRMIPESWTGDDAISSPGISPALAGFVHRTECAAVVADNFAVEALPPSGGWSQSAHVTMLRNLGLLFGELLWLGDLAHEAAEDERFDFLFVAVPLWVPGGLGSPSCALAIR